MNKNNEQQADEADMDPIHEEEQESLFDSEGNPPEIDFERKFDSSMDD